MALLWEKRANDKGNIGSKDKNIYGAQAVNEVCDYLFYSDFSENEIIPFFDIFDKFNKYYTTNNADTAIRQLENNLFKQIKATSVSPLELILYSSRKINNYIKSNEKVFNRITEILKNHINNNYESIKCMANNWEWRIQLLMLAEACGKSFDNTSIEIMMNSYERILSLFDKANVIKVHRAFVRMILHTQNADNMKYLIDVVSSDSFVNNPDSFNIIKKQILSQNSFVILDNNKKIFVEQLNDKNISDNSFKFKVANLVGYAGETPSLEQEWKWDKESAKSIYRLIGIHDETELPKIIEMFLRNWSNITGKINQQRMIYTVAEKAKESKDPTTINAVQAFCENILSIESENIHTGAYLGLYILGDRSAIEKAMSIAFTTDNYSSLISLANYFRFRPDLFEGVFIEFIEGELVKCDWDTYMVDKYIKNLKTVIEAFDGGEKKNDKLNSVKKFNSSIIDISKLILKKINDNSICNTLIDILYKVGLESPDQTDSVLMVLDLFKESELNISAPILKRVGGIIKNLEGNGLPTT